MWLLWYVILVKETITVPNTAGVCAAPDIKNNKVILKSCAPFIDCINEINNRQVHNVEDTDELMPIYNLTEYSYIYSNALGSFWQYCEMNQV